MRLTDLSDGFLHLVLVLKHVNHVGGVLDDKRHNRDVGQAEHLGQVDLLPSASGGVQTATSFHLPGALRGSERVVVIHRRRTGSLGINGAATD